MPPGPKQQWDDLGPAKRAGVVAATVVQLTLLVVAQKDLGSRDPEELRGPKWFWRVAVLVNFAGPIAYFAVGRRYGSRR